MPVPVLHCDWFKICINEPQLLPVWEPLGGAISLTITQNRDNKVFTNPSPGEPLPLHSV